MGGGRKISWVKWSKVCQPKCMGGPVIRDIRLVNLSLLAKWRWRMVQGGGALWNEVLREKYGFKIDNLLDGEVGNWPRYASNWWKGIATIDDGGGVNWFNEKVERRVRGGGIKKRRWWRICGGIPVKFQSEFHMEEEAFCLGGRPP